jgi:hypothetical protein
VAEHRSLTGLRCKGAELGAAKANGNLGGEYLKQGEIIEACSKFYPNLWQITKLCLVQTEKVEVHPSHISKRI